MIQDHAMGLEAPRRILVPVDLSPLSYQALDLARHLGGTDCAIRLFYALTPAFTAPLYVVEAVTPLYDRELTQSQLAEAKKALTEYGLAGGGSVDVKVVESATAAEAIADEALAYKADLVLMTTHGRGGLSGLFSGSVAQKLFSIYHGPIVLLRPQRQHPAA